MPSGGGKPLDRSIVEGPLARAVWMLAWPTMLQNLIGGLQGVVDHALVGHFVGYAGNAAIGVGIQIFIVVIAFVMSVFSGMGVLVSRFAGANDPEKVNRTVYQAFLAALALWGLLLAPLGWVLAPSLLGVVNAAPAVRHEALPFLRIMFVGSIGMLLFFMVGGALRPARRRPRDRGERRGRVAAPLHRLAGAGRPGASRVRGRLHRAVLVHHVDVGRVDGRRRHRRGSEPGGAPS